MNKASLLAPFIVAALLITSCSIKYEEKSIYYIENYSAEIIPAVEAALTDLDTWLVSSSRDEQLLDRLRCHANPCSAAIVF